MFKITCMKCGKETILTQGNITINTDNNNIDFSTTGYGGEVGMWCKCENYVDYSTPTEKEEPTELGKRFAKMYEKKIIEILDTKVLDIDKKYTYVGQDIKIKTLGD